MKMYSNKVFKILILFILIWFDLYRWGVPFFSFTLYFYFLTRNLFKTIFLFVYLGTVYGIYLVSPPKNLIQVLVVWFVEAPLKSIIPLFIVFFIYNNIRNNIRNTNKLKK